MYIYINNKIEENKNKLLFFNSKIEENKKKLKDHVDRMLENKLTKKIINCQPIGNRHSSRPSKRLLNERNQSR